MTSSPVRVLAIGGLDPCGGAGITADARVAGALGAFPLTVATCLTVQNRHGFSGVHVVGEPVLRATLDAAVADGDVGAVKIGMVGVPRTLGIVLDVCEAALPGVPVVVDPVLSSTAVGWVTGEDVVAAYRDGLTRMTVLTPNLDEASRLWPEGRGRDASGPAVLVKGGHGTARVVEDRLEVGGEVVTFRHPRVDSGAVHGTGCALSTALAVGLAEGRGVTAACEAAIAFVGRCLAATPRAADGLPVPLAVV